MSGTEDAVFLRVIDGLTRLGIPYMVVGSYASNVHGQPRDSFDADIVVDFKPPAVEAFCREFESEFVLSREAVELCVTRAEMFNLIPFSAAFKVDLIPLRRGAYEAEEFSRRVAIPAFGRTIHFARAEDVILSKLVWYRKGGGSSERQWKDVRGVAAAQGVRLDRAYLTRWAERLGVADLLQRLVE